MPIEFPSQSTNFLYSQCIQCGMTCKGPKINIKMDCFDARIRSLMSTAIAFPYSFKGYLSNKEGLTISTPNNRAYTLNTYGDFHITFTQGQAPQIIWKVHECPRKLTREEVLSLWQNGQRCFENANVEDILWAACQESSPANADETNSALANLEPSVAVQEVLEKKEELDIGICEHSGNLNSFTYSGTGGKNIVTSSSPISSTTTLELCNGRTLHIEVKKEGIFIDEKLLESGIGRFTLQVLPGMDNYKLIKI